MAAAATDCEDFRQKIAMACSSAFSVNSLRISRSMAGEIKRFSASAAAASTKLAAVNHYLQSVYAVGNP